MLDSSDSMRSSGSCASDSARFIAASSPNAARKAGDTVEVLSPPKANHFDIVTPGLPNGDATVDWIAANAFTSAR